jgi:death-on-curing protein
MPASKDVTYLDLRNVLRAHANVFGISPDQAADHVRNLDGLRSAIERPRQYAHYQEADIALQAAALSHAIAEGQLFVDGNKRTAAYALLAFLHFNGLTLNCDEATLAVWAFCLSKGETIEDLAERVRGALVPFTP